MQENSPQNINLVFYLEDLCYNSYWYSLKMLLNLRKCKVDAVYMDFRKAFDFVSHEQTSVSWKNWRLT